MISATTQTRKWNQAIQTTARSTVSSVSIPIGAVRSSRVGQPSGSGGGPDRTHSASGTPTTSKSSASAARTTCPVDRGSSAGAWWKRDGSGGLATNRPAFCCVMTIS
jgi:hypothetical protein